MSRNVVTGLLLAALAAVPGVEAAAAEPAKPLYEKTIAKYPSPKLEDVGGREYKALFDPAKVGTNAKDGLKEIWEKVKASAAKNGFTVNEKAKSPLKLEFSTKEYFDTPGQDLWKKGLIVRVTQKFKDGDPEPNVTLTVKSVLEDAIQAMAVPLTIVGGEKPKTEAEENVGMGPGGELRGYVEKGSTVTLPPAALGGKTLGELGKFFPDLLKTGLAADTKLVGTKAWSTRVRPGDIVLPGTEPCGVSMEAWSAKEGGAPYLYDFSYCYGDLDFYGVAATHAAGEKFLLTVVHGDLKDLGMPDNEKWGGSKVRKLMNRPIPAK